MESQNNLINVIVWFRQVFNGEVEKESELLKINAKTPQEAVNLAKEKFTSLKQIPFQFIVNGEIVEPN